MSVRIFAVVLLLGLPNLALAQASPDAGAAALPALPSLLARIADRIAEAPRLQFLRAETTEELDSSGKAKSTQIIRSKVTQLADGGQSTDVLSASQDGADLTAQVKQQRALASKGTADKDDVRVTAISPFKPDQQPLYAFRLAGGDASAPLIHFEPKGAASPQLLIGEAVIDAGSAAVLSVHSRPAVFPNHVDSMMIETDYTGAPPGATPVRMVLVGSGHFLFFKQHLRVTEVFSDFYPATKP